MMCKQLVQLELGILKIFSCVAQRLQCLLPPPSRLVPKRATTLQFSSDDSHVLVADKTGEVIRYILN